MKKLIHIIIAACLLAGCGSKKNDSDNSAPSLPPATAVLVFPAQNSLCVSGNVISVAQSSVTFKWSAADNAESYDISIRNLLTSVVATQNVNQAQATVTLSRNVPYSWFIISRSSKNTAIATSDVWKFYNSGAGVTAYAPFPADNLSPSLGQNVTATNGKITLTWAGSDIDNDIAGYDVYLGTTSSPSLYKKDITGNSLDVAVNTTTKYYWKVITKDMAGNTSESNLIQFSIN